MARGQGRPPAQAAERGGVTAGDRGGAGSTADAWDTGPRRRGEQKEARQAGVTCWGARAVAQGAASRAEAEAGRRRRTARRVLAANSRVLVVLVLILLCLLRLGRLLRRRLALALLGRAARVRLDCGGRGWREGQGPTGQSASCARRQARRMHDVRTPLLPLLPAAAQTLHSEAVYKSTAALRLCTHQHPAARSCPCRCQSRGRRAAARAPTSAGCPTARSTAQAPTRASRRPGPAPRAWRRGEGRWGGEQAEPSETSPPPARQVREAG